METGIDLYWFGSIGMDQRCVCVCVSFLLWGLLRVEKTWEDKGSNCNCLPQSMFRLSWKLLLHKCLCQLRRVTVPDIVHQSIMHLGKWMLNAEPFHILSQELLIHREREEEPQARHSISLGHITANYGITRFTSSFHLGRSLLFVDPVDRTHTWGHRISPCCQVQLSLAPGECAGSDARWKICVQLDSF